MSKSVMHNNKNFSHYLWLLALFSFIVAGLTGFGYRLGLIGVHLWGLNLENVRHAHSHLMFFGWAVPLPLYFIIQQMKRSGVGGDIIRKMNRRVLAAMLLGMASYPFFLGYGYQPVPIGEMELPVSVILSGLVILCWYSFMITYLKGRKQMESGRLSIQFINGALLMLFICSLGAWGVALVQFMGFQNPLYGKALTHFFLATFTEGWVVLVILGIVISRFNIENLHGPLSPDILLGCIIFGAPFTFPYGISESLLTPALLATASLGGALAAIGALLIVYSIIRSNRIRDTIWIWPIGMLGAKALMQLTASILPAGFWLSDHGLRILYLHILLLGGLTLTITGFLVKRANLSRLFFKLLAGAVSLVLLSLILLTRFWPQVWSGVWVFQVAAVVALLPILAMSIIWLQVSFLKSAEIYV